MSKTFVPTEMIMQMNIIKINVIFFVVKLSSFEGMPPDNLINSFSFILNSAC